MTYNELVEQINKLSEEQKNMTVICLNSQDAFFYNVCNVSVQTETDDEVIEGHSFLELD